MYYIITVLRGSWFCPRGMLPTPSESYLPFPKFQSQLAKKNCNPVRQVTFFKNPIPSSRFFKGEWNHACCFTLLLYQKTFSLWSNSSVTDVFLVVFRGGLDIFLPKNSQKLSQSWKENTCLRVHLRIFSE